MTLEEWADKEKLIVSYPEEIKALPGPAIGFIYETTATEVVMDLNDEGIPSELFQLNSDWYVIERR